jgi:hypothetical protein
MTILAPCPPQVPPAPGPSRAPAHPLAFFRGLALALPTSLLLWIALVRLAWGLWRG